MQRPRDTERHNVIILGMHRSGTSMVARALAAAGLYVGTPEEMLAAQPDNPRGFCERQDVVELNDRILGDAGASWYRPGSIAHLAVDRYRSSIREILDRLPDQGWLIKDPRMALTWPAWAPVLGNATILYVYRSPMAVAQSLERRNGLPMDYGLALWEYYNRAALAVEPPGAFHAVSYDAIASDPGVRIRAMVEKLVEEGVPLQSFDIDDIFEPSLDHSGASTADYPLRQEQRNLHDICLRTVESDERPLTLGNAWRAPLEARIGSFAQAHAANLEAKALIGERDSLASDRADLLARYQELRASHDAAEHELTRTRANLDSVERELDHTQRHLRKAEAKAEYLYHQLDALTGQLLGFNRSTLGQAVRSFVWGYKVVTLRPGRSTALQDVVKQSRTLREATGLSSLSESRLEITVSVLRFVLTHPYTTLRNLSLARVVAVARTLTSAHPADLAIWARQRFPVNASEEISAINPEFEAELDDLRLDFPPCDAPRVSIIIPVFNQYRMTMNCLRSVHRHTRDIPYEVILGDDASSDLTATIEDRVSGITVARSAENSGFVRNCNYAARRAKGELLVFLNNDTQVTDGWLPALVATMDAHPQVAIVGPKLLSENGLLQEAGGIIWRDASGWNFGRGDDPRRPEYNYVKACDYVSGACMLVRAELWNSVEGFDTRFAPAYYEDTDLCFTARREGYEVTYQPAATVYHFEGVSHGTSLNSGIKRNQAINQETFREKWRSELTGQFENGSNVYWARDRSAQRRTILVVDHYVPFFDKDAGSRATWLYLQQFVEMGYNVKFLGANFFRHQPYTEALEQAGIEVLAGEEMARTVADWLRLNARYIHAVYLNRPHVAEQFLDILDAMSPRPRIVYFGHDLHYLRKQREFETLGLRHLANEAEEWKRREYQVFEKADRVLYPSDEEVREIKRRRPEINASTLPLYVVEDASGIPDYDPDRRRDILFVGGFNHTPNVDAVVWFVDSILPKILEAGLDWRFHVVGSNMPTRISDLHGNGVIAHGFLEQRDLDALYAQCALAVVPLRYGAGVKGKVLEAMLNGVPVVTTPIGAEGLPDPHSVFHIAEDETNLAGKIIEVAEKGPSVEEKLGRYQRYLESHFGVRRVRELIRAEFGPPRLDVPHVTESSAALN